jgi:tRNA(Ile)-lysidine synthase
MDALVDAGAPWPGAVAVSGGGDSVALMHLLAQWAKARRLAAPIVLTVDHGLVPGSSKAAKKVVAWARKAGLETRALVWKGPKPKGDVEAEAREARYRLMGQALRREKIGALYVGHTRDDQAETFLLRLGRGSGLDGLAAMRPHAPYPVAEFNELALVRPLLEVERTKLRGHLEALEQPWLEDTMNKDDRFARVRIRQAWGALEGAGLSKERLVDAAAHLARAREALDQVTVAVLARAARLEDGMAFAEPAALTSAPREVGLRALARLLMAISGQTYRPRFERLERLFARIEAGEIGGGCTLHGCRIAVAPRSRAVFGPGTLEIMRETGRARNAGTERGDLA